MEREGEAGAELGHLGVAIDAFASSESAGGVTLRSQAREDRGQPYDMDPPLDP